MADEHGFGLGRVLRASEPTTELLRKLAELERAGAVALREMPMPRGLDSPALLLHGAAIARADAFEAMAAERTRTAMVQLSGPGLVTAESLEPEEIEARLIDAIEHRDKMVGDCARGERGSAGLSAGPPMSARNFATLILELVRKERAA